MDHQVLVVVTAAAGVRGGWGAGGANVARILRLDPAGAVLFFWRRMSLRSRRSPEANMVDEDGLGFGSVVNWRRCWTPLRVLCRLFL